MSSQDGTVTNPAAMVTFLMTDIEGSTRLWEEHREAMATALEAHDEILKEAVEGHGGAIVKTTGDGMLAVFDRPDGAIGSAVDVQRALGRHAWGETGPLRVRMALHSGSAQSRDQDYYGPAVNRVARLLAIGNGGQVLVSGTTAMFGREGLPPGIELVDRGEHQLRDLEIAERVFDLTGDGISGAGKPLRSLAVSRTNLPLPVTSFIGREHERAELRELVTGHRLLTLIGTGGTGKTRLMLQVGSDLVETFPDGVWLTELAALSDPALVTQQIARAVGAGEDPGRTVLEALTDFLRAKTLLLLIDNCEHVIGSAAEVTEQTLAACPGLSVMASSREALAVSGERVFQVPSLSLPPSIGSTDVDEATEGWFAQVAGVETVRLFVERARDALPSFELTLENAPSVVEICRRLDGIPLAIELAAARIGVLSAEEIALRLGDRFRLLTGGRRTAVPRQQTLQALIDWSWDLLNEADQKLLRNLSVFAGGWTLGSAVAVTDAAEDRDDPQLVTLDGLSRLVDRSLVVVEHAGVTRYRMLETIRQYARDRLVESGEASRLRDRHLDHFLSVALVAAPALEGSEMIYWLERLDADADNFRAALDWAFEADPERALELTVALQPYWRSRSYGSEATGRIRAAVDLALSLLPAYAAPDPDTERAVLVSRTLSAGSMAQATWAEAAVARPWAETAVELARGSHDPRALGEALGAKALVAVFSGEAAGIESLFDESVQLSQQVGDLFLLAMAGAGSGMWRAMAGDLAGADTWIKDATDAANRSGNPLAIAYTAVSRGNIVDLAGRPMDARPWYTMAIEAFERMGDRRFALIARSDLAHALRRGGALDEAESTYRETLHDWQHAGNRGAVANQLECLAFIDIARGDTARATRLLSAAEVIREQADQPRLGIEREEYDVALATLREQLAGDEFESAWTDGRRLTSDEAIALALADRQA